MDCDINVHEILTSDPESSQEGTIIEVAGRTEQDLLPHLTISDASRNEQRDDVGANPDGTPINSPAAEGRTRRRRNKRLCGAARKRLKMLMDNSGLDFRTALSFCRNQWKDIPVEKPASVKPHKRARSEDESPKVQPKKTPRLSSGAAGRFTYAPTYGDIAGATRVGIRNSEPMTAEQLRLVHRSIVDSIMKSGARSQSLKFASVTLKPGWILVTIENQETLDWLVGEIPKCKPWTGAQLKVLLESELPKAATATTFIQRTDAESVAQAMALLKMQNEGLLTEHWRVLNVREEEHGRVLTFALDEYSLESLRKARFFANVGLRKVVFKVKGEDQSTPNMPKQTTTTASASLVSRTACPAIPGPSGLGSGTPNPGTTRQGGTSSSPCLKGRGPKPGASGSGGRASGVPTPGPSGRGNSSHDGRVTAGTGPRTNLGRVPKTTPDRGTSSQSGRGKTRPLPVIKRGK